MKRLLPHPLSELLPPLGPEQFAALKDAIAHNKGLLKPVVLFDGKILDGRHRAIACYELGLPVRTIEFDPAWGSPAFFVYQNSLNREMTVSQKAAAAVEVADALAAEAESRSRSNLKKGSRPGNISVPQGESRDLAGSLWRVSGRYVSEAKAIREHDAKLYSAVRLGAVTIAQAKREIHRNKKRKALAKPAAAPSAQAWETWDIIAGDCLKVMPTMPRRHARLIFADPPYNQSIDYGDGEKADARSESEYLDECAQWMAECFELLAPDGTMCVLISDEYAAHYAIMLGEIGFHRRSWIKWYESFGVNCNNNFNRCSRHVFYCVKDEQNFVFNPDAFNRQSDRQVKYGDKRANPKGKIWDNVWGINPPIPRLVDNAPERMPDFRTQLPLALLKPIVEGFSDPGDVVLDPFSGSGTTVAAAKLLGRKGIGIEKNAARAEQSRQRLASV